MYQGEDITEHNNQRKLNILKGFVEVTDIIEKGHMDFGGGKAPVVGKGNLVQKKITDKSGHNTTRWVKNDQDETGQDESNVEAEQSSEGVKTSEDHAKETQSEDLKTYIANNPDGEHVAAAQAELQARGESEGIDNSGEENNEGGSFDEGQESTVGDITAVRQKLADWNRYETGDEVDQALTTFEESPTKETYDSLVKTLRDWDLYQPGDEVDEALQSVNPTDNEGAASYEEGEGFSGSEGGVNYDDPNSVSQAISENRDAILDLLTSDPSLNAITALKLHMANSGSNTEAHGALDAAQQALDAAKSATGHPGATSGEGEVEGEQTSEGLEGAKQWLNDFIEQSDNDEVMSEDILSNCPEEYQEFIEQAFEEYGDEDKEGEDEEEGDGDSNFHKQDEDKNSDNSEGFGGGDTESEDDGSGKEQDEKEKKKPNFGKK